MNWYKKSQKLEKEARIKALHAFLLGVAAGLVPLTVSIVSQVMKVPEEQAQQIIETDPHSVVEEARRQAEAIENSAPQEVFPTNSPPEANSDQQTSEIDMNRIIQIESSGDPNAVSPVGARGLTQIMEYTWDEAVRRMGKSWSFDEAFDPDKNLQVGTWYFNQRIPQMLNHYGIPDTTDTRIAAYNWGIGNLKKTYERYGNQWLEYAPQETQNYIRKYNGS